MLLVKQLRLTMPFLIALVACTGAAPSGDRVRRISDDPIPIAQVIDTEDGNRYVSHSPVVVRWSYSSPDVVSIEFAGWKDPQIWSFAGIADLRDLLDDLALDLSVQDYGSGAGSAQVNLQAEDYTVLWHATEGRAVVQLDGNAGVTMAIDSEDPRAAAHASGRVVVVCQTASGYDDSLASDECRQFGVISWD